MFINAADGVQLFSYYETRETELEVLLSGNRKGGALAPARSCEVSLCVVNDRSARLSATDSSIEDESVFELNTTHVDTPNLIDQNGIRGFIDIIDTLIKNFSVAQRDHHKRLNSKIMKKVLVDIHQLYQSREPALMKVWSVKPSLEEFFHKGPTKCLDGSIIESKSNYKAPTNGIVEPTREIELTVPSIEITLADSSEEMASPVQKSTSSLFSSESKNLSGKRTPHPLLDDNFSSIKRPDHSGPAKVPTNSVNLPASDEIQGAPQHPPTYQISTSPVDLFKWIHIPFTHSGWVPVSNNIQKPGLLPAH